MEPQTSISLLIAVTLIIHFAGAQTCTEKRSDGKGRLTCSGYPSIPLQNITNSEVLDMSNGNNLQTIKTEEFSNAGFYNLEKIILSNNQIRSIEKGAFRKLDRLAIVDLSYNKLDSLELDIFESPNDTVKLQILQLNNNPIRQFKGTVLTPLPLTKIYLNNCSLTEIPRDGFSKLEKLMEIDLRSNQLKRLDWDVFKDTHELSTVLLSGNPWNCDCHVKFLQEFLKLKSVQLDNDVVCNGPLKLAKMNWVNASSLSNGLVCQPQIVDLKPVGSFYYNSSESGDLIVYSELGKDVTFECVIEAYPEPTIGWTKDGKLLRDEGYTDFQDNNNNTGRSLPESGSEPEVQPHIKIVARSNDFNDKQYEKYKYNHAKLLIIYKANLNDSGKYVCLAKHENGTVSKSVFLEFVNIPIVDRVRTGGSGKTWLWIMIALLILIVIAIFILCITIWKKRQHKQQKGSDVILDEAFHQNSLQRQISKDARTPLLPQEENRLQTNTSTISRIPDVAQGKPEQPRSLSPDVFSPRPPLSADLRRQFFASQNSQAQDRPSRPGSAMSLNFYQPPQRQYSLPQQFYSQRQSDLYSNYHPLRRPGSAQSLIHPDPSYGSRSMLTRQFSGPAYSTMRLPPRRPPSVSSCTSEHPYDRRYPHPGYVTLPRNFPPPRMDSGFGPSLSPTESNYSYASSYSTLPRGHPFGYNPGITHDSVGPRTTADGGSNLSLNKIGDPNLNTLDSINQGLLSPTKGKIKPGRNRMSSSTTPGSLRGRNDFFSFEPIQEVEGSEDVLAQLPSNTEIDKLFPLLQTQPQVQESRYKKKRPPPISSIPPRSRKPIRTFDYAKPREIANSNETNEASPDAPSLPLSPPPMSSRNLTSIENIIEEVEGTEV